MSDMGGRLGQPKGTHRHDLQPPGMQVPDVSQPLRWPSKSSKYCVRTASNVLESLLVRCCLPVHLSCVLDRLSSVGLRPLLQALPLRGPLRAPGTYLHAAACSRPFSPTQAPSQPRLAAPVLVCSIIMYVLIVPPNKHPSMPVATVMYSLCSCTPSMQVASGYISSRSSAPPRTGRSIECDPDARPFSCIILCTLDNACFYMFRCTLLRSETRVQMVCRALLFLCLL